MLECYTNINPMKEYKDGYIVSYQEYIEMLSLQDYTASTKDDDNVIKTGLRKDNKPIYLK